MRDKLRWIETLFAWRGYARRAPGCRRGRRKDSAAIGGGRKHGARGRDALQHPQPVVPPATHRRSAAGYTMVRGALAGHVLLLRWCGRPDPPPNSHQYGSADVGFLCKADPAAWTAVNLRCLMNFELRAVGTGIVPHVRRCAAFGADAACGCGASRPQERLARGGPRSPQGDQSRV